MKRCIVLVICVLLIQGINLSAGGAKQGAPANVDDDYVIKVGIGITAGLCTAPFFIASEKGFYAEEGL
jgi:ABC-type nitrate/sulfonate/bicarbonate transport system substrate-binding protein